MRRPPRSTPCPYPTLCQPLGVVAAAHQPRLAARRGGLGLQLLDRHAAVPVARAGEAGRLRLDRSGEDTSEPQTRQCIVLRLLAVQKKKYIGFLLLLSHNIR